METANELHLTSIALPAAVYAELKQLWDLLEHYWLSFFDHGADYAEAIAFQYRLEQAIAWINTHPRDYEFGVNSGRWRLGDRLEDGKFTSHTDIICRRWNEGYSANALTNMPRLVAHHSPAGHEWGYPGSGCSDLALDILNWQFPRPTPETGIQCWAGISDRWAWKFHIPFRNAFIVPLEREGGVIPTASVQQWIQQQNLRREA